MLTYMIDCVDRNFEAGLISEVERDEEIQALIDNCQDEVH